MNPKLTLKGVEEYQKEMFQFPTYNCFEVFVEDKLIGISSGWITVRLYSGKQLGVDNIIIDNSVQSKAFGKKFFEFIEVVGKEKWMQNNGIKYLSSEL